MEEELLLVTRTRALAFLVLFAWLFFHVVLTLFIVTFSTSIPYLSLFIHLAFLCLFILYASRRWLIISYMKVTERLVISQISRFLSVRQRQENAIAIQMLRSVMSR